MKEKIVKIICIGLEQGDSVSKISDSILSALSAEGEVISDDEIWSALDNVWQGQLDRTKTYPSNPLLDEMKAIAKAQAAHTTAILTAKFEAEKAEAKANRPKVVCLCGSTRFKQEFIKANFDETMKGNIVVTVGWFSHADKESYFPTPEEKIKLDELHKRKIDLADEVLVLNVGGYIGESTRSEINYAEAHGKPVRYLEPEATNNVELKYFRDYRRGHKLTSEKQILYKGG